MQKLIIEARINEYAMRDQNPNVPWTPEEIARDAAECRAAGASIVHFHARKPDGAPCHDEREYAETIARVHETCDVLVHPTLGAFTLSASAEGRLAHVLNMAKDPRTRPDFAPLDMGSTNVDLYDPKKRRFLSNETVYTNTTATLQYFAEQIRQAGLKPALAIWNVAFLRQALAFLDAGLIDEPVYCTFLLSEPPYLAGHPATEEGLRAFTAFLPKDRRIEWSALALASNLLDIAEPVLRAGGHIAIGLGDHSYAELGRPRNADLVARVANLARSLGREVASPEETRDILAMRQPQTRQAVSA